MQPLPTPAGVSLRELLADEVRGPLAADLRAASCTSDWRQVRPGDVFVAITDAEDDGHDGASVAAESGAAAVVCERPLPVFNIPQFVVADSRSAYGRLCQALVGDPSQQMKVIGVTGTSGKTTVSRLLTSIFRAAGAAAGNLDSFGYWDGWEDRPALDGPLSPPMLARSLAEMSATGVRHAVVEISSRDLSQAALAGVRLDAVCMTHVGRDHLDWHGSVQNYRRAKKRVFEQLATEGVAVLNADDPVCVEMLCELDRPMLTFGLKKPAEISAEIIEQHVNEQTFVLTTGDESVGVRTELVGEHHIYNCLAAATMGLAYGIDLTTVARGLEAVDRLPGRMERIMGGQEFALFVDAAQSPDTLRATLRAARQVTRGRVICVFGAPGEQEIEQRQVMGRVVGSMADVAVVTTNAPRGEDARMICLQVRSGFADLSRPQIVLDRTAAIAHAMQLARAGDTVVIAGMGERPYGTDKEGMPMGDAEIARKALRGTLSSAAQQRLAA
ncbi:MAG: UDP-N-acetylmuramoyl-L-alanyl-D-glutamate--2,6-diaminopimelate ligase [Pirellulales bacterium]